MDSTEEVEARTGPRPSARLSIIVLAVGGLWVLLHGIGVLDPDGYITFPVMAILAGTAIVVGLRTVAPGDDVALAHLRRGAPALHGGGRPADRLLARSGTSVPSRSLVPDVLALPAYALLALGVAGLAGVGLRNRDDVDAILDGVVAALAVLMMAWVYLVTPALSTQSISLPVQMTLGRLPGG